MPTDEQLSPLSAALVRLLDAYALKDVRLAAVLGCEIPQIEAMREGLLPGDQMMTTILLGLEPTKGSENAGDRAAALDNFWQVVAACENGTSLPPELSMNPGESLAARITRWTNDGWTENIIRSIGLIPPRRRADFIGAITEAFNKYVEYK